MYSKELEQWLLKNVVVQGSFPVEPCTAKITGQNSLAVLAVHGWTWKTALHNSVFEENIALLSL